MSFVLDNRYCVSVSEVHSLELLKVLPHDWTILRHPKYLQCTLAVSVLSYHHAYQTFEVALYFIAHARDLSKSLSKSTLVSR